MSTVLFFVTQGLVCARGSHARVQLLTQQQQEVCKEESTPLYSTVNDILFELY